MAQTNPPFDSTLLPDSMRAPVSEALAQERYGAAAALITDYLAAGEPRDPVVLICLAFCLVEAACNGPFEHILSRANEGLDLLREARELGAEVATVRPVRTRIQRAQKREREMQDLEAAPPQTLDAEALRRVRKRAYALADRKEKAGWLTSARLWRVLYHQAKTAPDTDIIKDDFYAFARAGLTFAQSGRFDLAQPYLDTIVDLDRPITGRESWMVEYAYREFLLHAAAEHDRGAFEALWWRAEGAAQAEGGHFPFARPSQERFLALALAFQLPAICQHLITMIDQRRPKRTLSAEVKDTLAQARAYVAGARSSM